MRYILLSPGLAPCRCRSLSSNVRPHTTPIVAIQRSVQQQNAQTKEHMLHCAKLLESEDELPWLHTLLRQQGHEPNQGALVSLEQVPDQGGDFYSGLWIGPDHRFWHFAATVEPNSVGIALESFSETTGEIIVTKHGRGTGNSFGQLAIEVLGERRAASLARAKFPQQAGEA